MNHGEEASWSKSFFTLGHVQVYGTDTDVCALHFIDRKHTSKQQLHISKQRSVHRIFTVHSALTCEDFSWRESTRPLIAWQGAAALSFLK